MNYSNLLHNHFLSNFDKNIIIYIYAYLCVNPLLRVCVYIIKSLNQIMFVCIINIIM